MPLAILFLLLCCAPLCLEASSRMVCGTPWSVAGYHGEESGVRSKRLAGRPVRARSLRSEEGHFRIHYDVEGPHAVAAADADGNGAPDYADSVAAIAERIRRLQVGALGYRPPPRDKDKGGGDEYDIYVSELGSGCGAFCAYGYTHPEEKAAGPHASSSYAEIDNDYLDPGYARTRGLAALRVTLAHELFHGVQFGYYDGADDCWWQEGSATWMEDFAFPEVDDYLQYLPDFLGHPGRGLDRGNCFSSYDSHIYGSALFAHFLEQRFGAQVVRGVWEEMEQSGSGSIEHFTRAIPGGLEEAVGEFAVWNYFTGERHRQGYYREGEKYPLAPFRMVHGPAKAAFDSGAVDHLATAYVRLQPAERPGGVRLRVQTGGGRWRQHLLLLGPQGARVEPLGGGEAEVADWGRFSEIVLVLTAVETQGGNYTYRVGAEYDADLSALRPAALALAPAYPNPFQPGAGGHATLPYALDRPASRILLSIFTSAGELVRRWELGPGEARFYAGPQWDGRNQRGERVGSGIYYCVLEADGQVARAKVAVRAP